MPSCPVCGTKNIQGADYCSSCEADLHEFGLPESGVGLGGELVGTSIMALRPELDVSVSPEDTVRNVVRAMCDEDASAVLVHFQGKLVGLFTERDLLIKIADRYDALADEPIRKFMTPDPEYLTQDDSIAAGLNMMAVKKYRHIPIQQKDGSHVCLLVRDVLNYIVHREQVRAASCKQS